MIQASDIQIGDRVKVFLDSDFWQSDGWFEGTVIRIDPYSAHRSFYWVELDETILATFPRATRLISVFNPKNIQKID
jgi:hypothetical protein